LHEKGSRGTLFIYKYIFLYIKKRKRKKEVGKCDLSDPVDPVDPAVTPYASFKRASLQYWNQYNQLHL